MLDIFLSNKIASTVEGWTDDLILIANIFNDFEGRTYDRAAIESRFEEISGRVPDARDASDYRDEYGAYGSFLGIVNYEQAGNNWICHVSPAAKQLLCSILPDPQAFMRLQMSLFQYPNPIGAVYHENGTGTLHLEPLSSKKRVQQVASGVQTVPFRLLLRVLLGLHNQFGPTEANLTYPEIWHCLFTKPEAVGTFDPDGVALARNVMAFREKPIAGHKTAALRNLHVLNHTGLVVKPAHSSQISLIPQAGNELTGLGRIARDIANMTASFPIPNGSVLEVKQWAKQALISGTWSNYYGGTQIPAATMASLLENISEVDTDLLTDPAFGPGAPLLDFERERKSRKSRLDKRPASPEESEALREKANTAHRALVKLVADRLLAQDVKPESNIFVDLCCREPKRMLFEIKSCRPENILAQVRKGISQLYEYRYRHDELSDAKLVLALEARPEGSLEWLIDYLVGDRAIAVCWQEGDHGLACPSYCQDCLGNIVNRIEQFT